MMLHTTLETLDTLEAACEGREGATKVGKALLKRMCMDHRAMHAALRDAGVKVED